MELPKLRIACEMKFICFHNKQVCVYNFLHVFGMVFRVK